MVICFNATTEAKKALDTLLATGEFRDISEAASMALVNYDVLHKTMTHSGMVFDSIRPAPSAPTAGQAHNQPNSSIAQPSPEGTSTPPQLSAQPTIPRLFNLHAAPPEVLTFLEISAPTHPVTANLSPALWLFGQFNKFLAPKATCRALFNLLLDNPAGISVNEAVSKISHAACGLGDYLQILDDRLHSRREDAFSAAFPSSAIDGGGESRLRFGNQFVASTRQGQLGGFPAALKLVALDTAKEPRLSLTKAGAQFALFENPVIDAGETPPSRKLSQEEIDFLLAHIAKSVPPEVSAYKSILDALSSGANSPDAVDKYLRKRFNLPTVDDISTTFLTTQRTGVISRMVDLGLLARKKEGLRVTYFATPSGSDFTALTE